MINQSLDVLYGRVWLASGATSKIAFVTSLIWILNEKDGDVSAISRLFLVVDGEKILPLLEVKTSDTPSLAVTRNQNTYGLYDVCRSSIT